MWNRPRPISAEKCLISASAKKAYLFRIELAVSEQEFHEFGEQSAYLYTDDEVAFMFIKFRRASKVEVLGLIDSFVVSVGKDIDFNLNSMYTIILEVRATITPEDYARKSLRMWAS